MSEVVKELEAIEKTIAEEYQEKLAAVKRTRELFMLRDTTATERPMASLGSNEPTATDLLRTKVFTNGDSLNFKEVMARAKKAGFHGPESRIRGALRRLTETNELAKRGKGYRRTKRAA